MEKEKTGTEEAKETKKSTTCHSKITIQAKDNGSVKLNTRPHKDQCGNCGKSGKIHENNGMSDASLRMMLVCDSCHESKQKFEEIKRMAFEFSKEALFHTIIVKGKKLKTPDQIMLWCWGCAEGFYKLAKQKEKEMVG